MIHGNRRGHVWEGRKVAVADRPPALAVSPRDWHKLDVYGFSAMQPKCLSKAQADLIWNPEPSCQHRTSPMTYYQ